jgi:Fe-Mn family superoxide dismutase
MIYTYPYSLPPLSYGFDAFEPVTSEWTFKTHYRKNQAAYVKALNKLCREQPQLQDMSLGEIVRTSNGHLFNMAAQHWNHTFLWENLTYPQEDNKPPKNLLSILERAFGSFANFKDQFVEIGTKEFGSGWVWLITDQHHNLGIVSTPNAHNPMVDGYVPLLIIDLWEHAYHCDYQNRRKEYLQNSFALIDWEKVEQRLLEGDALYY